MSEMKTLNGYEIVDAKARQDIANIIIPTVPSKVSELENDAQYATMREVKQAVMDAATDSYFLNFSDAPDEMNAKAADANITAFADAIVNGKDVCANIIDSHDRIYYPALIQPQANNGTWNIYLMKAGGNLNLLSNGTWKWDTICIIGNSTNGWKYYKVASSSFQFVSKDYVDELEARIAALEGNN